MKRVFLSYSSKDKAQVEVLARDLRDAKIKVWLDEREILAGDSISKKVEEGISKSGYLAVWLSNNAMESGWVDREWRAMLQKQLDLGSRKIIPLLVDDVEIPVILADIRAADFRRGYSSGFADLVRAIRRPDSQAEALVSEYALDFIENLERATIPFPIHGKIRLVDTLRQLPRSGKKIRLETYSKPLQIRSVYDHVLSTAHSADCLFPYVSHGLQEHDRLDLARCAVFHDLPEAILGDAPFFTNLNDWKIRKARLFAETRLRSLPHGEAKRRTSAFIAMYLPERERESMEAAMKVLAQPENPIRRFFFVLDKLDPIIGVWRYLHQFRGALDPGARDFTRRLKDFFTNPYVMSIVSDYSDEMAIRGLVGLLQNHNQACAYYENGFVQDNPLGFPPELVTQLIEGRGLEFAEGNRIARETSGS